MRNSTRNEMNTVGEIAPLITPLIFIPSSDMSEYYSIKAQVFTMIDDLKNEGTSDEQIISTLGEKTNYSKDLIRFLILIHPKV